MRLRHSVGGRARALWLATLLTTCLSVAGLWLPTQVAAAGDPVAPASDWSVSVYALGSPLDEPGHVWDEVSGRLELQRFDGGIAISVSDDVQRGQITIAAPRGEEVTEKSYDVDDGIERVGHEGGLDLALGNTGCSFVSGTVTVHRYSPDLDSLRVSFDASCNGGRLFGEVRVGPDRSDDDSGAGVPTLTDDLVVAPHSITFPDLQPSSRADPVSVRVVNPGVAPALVGGVDVRGTDSDDVSTSDDCALLAPGAACTVSVDYGPGGAGPRRAELVVSTDRGDLTVQIAGVGLAGETAMRVASEQGTTVISEVDPDSSVFGSGDEHAVYFSATRGEERYALALRAPDGRVLQPGTYRATPVGLYDDATTSAGLVETMGLCGDPSDGSVTVLEAEYDEGGALQSMALTWEQSCFESPVGGLQGALVWRSERGLPPPAAVVPFEAEPVAGVEVFPSIGSVRVGFVAGGRRGPGPDISQVQARVRAGSRPMTSVTEGVELPIERELSNDQTSVVLDELRPGADYTVAFFVTPERTSRPAPTNVVLRGTSLSTSTRPARDGRVRIRGRLTARDGEQVGRRPILVDLEVGERFRTRRVVTDSRGRFSIGPTRARSVEAIFVGAGQLLGSVATTRSGGAR